MSNQKFDKITSDLAKVSIDKYADALAKELPIVSDRQSYEEYYFKQAEEEIQQTMKAGPPSAKAAEEALSKIDFAKPSTTAALIHIMYNSVAPVSIPLGSSSSHEYQILLNGDALTRLPALYYEDDPKESVSATSTNESTSTSKEGPITEADESYLHTFSGDSIASKLPKYAFVLGQILYADQAAKDNHFDETGYAAVIDATTLDLWAVVTASADNPDTPATFSFPGRTDEKCSAFKLKIAANKLVAGKLDLTASSIAATKVPYVTSINTKEWEEYKASRSTHKIISPQQ